MLSIVLGRLRHFHQVTRLLSFAALAGSLFVWLPTPASVAAPIADPNAYVTANVNLRAGPDTDYPAVILIPAQEYVTIYACIQDLTWCDVSYGDNRGWVAAQYVQPFYQDRYMTVQEYAPLVSLPTAPFDVRLYWSSFYSSQPFYGELDQWAAPRAALRTNSFYEPLGSYGDWVQEQDQYVWVPRGVDRDWRPYTRGRWVDTDQYGWFWASDEPFGWATYHYGRWGFSHDVGWFWCPGTRWAPAWVAWRGSDDYLGWAPLPPAPDDGLSISINIGSVPDYYWQVVPAQSFLSVNLSLVIVHDESVFRPAFERTRPLGNVTIVNNVVVNNVVNVNYIEQKTHRKVVAERVAAAGPADPSGKKALGKVAVFTPPAKGVATPPKLKKVEEVALVSKTKAQAGNKPAMDLATLEKLKGPPPGKKAKAGTPPPPPPVALTASAKTLSADKVGGKACLPGTVSNGKGGCLSLAQQAAQQALQKKLKVGGPLPPTLAGKTPDAAKVAGKVCPPGTVTNGHGGCFSPAQQAAQQALQKKLKAGPPPPPPPPLTESGKTLNAAKVAGKVCPPGTVGNGQGGCVSPAQQAAAQQALQRRGLPQCTGGHVLVGNQCQCPPAMTGNGQGACIPAQQATRQLALQQQAARQLALQQQAGRQLALQQQAARQLALQQQAARQIAMQQQAGRQLALQQQAARQLALQQQAARQIAMQQQAGRQLALQQQAARQLALQQQAARQIAMQQQAGRQLALQQQAAARQLALQQQAAHQQALQQQAAAQLAQQQAARQPGCPAGMMRNGQGVCRPRG